MSSSAQPARATASSRSRLPAGVPARSAISFATTASSSGVDTTCAPPFKSGSARRRTKSTLKRNRSSWTRVMAVSVSALGCDLKEARDEAAHVPRHRDEQVRQGDRRTRRVGRRAIGVPLVPQRGVGGPDVFAEAFVQRSETLGVVQVRKRVTGYAERCRGRCPVQCRTAPEMPGWWIGSLVAFTR